VGNAARVELIGGHRALDFVNSLAATVEHPDELLETYADLVDWSEHAAVITTAVAHELRMRASDDPAAAAAALSEALRLRADADAVLRASLDGRDPPPRSTARIRDAVVEALGHADLVPVGPRHEWRWADQDRLEAAHWPLAHDVVELLRSDQLGRLRRCVDCRWLFLDQSRNRSRRWCRMSGCGARAKMRRYRATRAR
jgi:predicted RNA-binding Zn ribbon-like protein